MVINAREAQEQIKSIISTRVIQLPPIILRSLEPASPNVASQLHCIYSTAAQLADNNRLKIGKASGVSLPEWEEVVVAQMLAGPGALSRCIHPGFNVGVSCSMAGGTTQRPPTSHG